MRMSGTIVYLYLFVICNFVSVYIQTNLREWHFNRTINSFSKYICVQLCPVKHGHGGLRTHALKRVYIVMKTHSHCRFTSTYERLQQFEEDIAFAAFGRTEIPAHPLSLPEWWGRMQVSVSGVTEEYPILCGVAVKKNSPVVLLVNA